MNRKLLTAAMAVSGCVLFFSVLAVVGPESILEPFKSFSPLYLTLFLLATGALHILGTLRWATVLKYQGIKAPFLLLLRYKLIGTAISYVTPASRVGGEPVRAYLFKNKMGILGRQSVSSILIETSLGMSIDAFFTALIILGMLLFFTLPAQLAGIALALAIGVLVLIVLFYSTLFGRFGPFSSFFRALHIILRKPYLKSLVHKIVAVEESMIEFLHLRKRGVVEAILVSMMTWPLTFLQYKFALLSIGFNAPANLVLFSIVATALTALIPIPASFGVQEAGHLSIFHPVGLANVGIALSLLIRFKDVLATLLGLALLSHEGLSIREVVKVRQEEKEG